MSGDHDGERWRHTAGRCLPQRAGQWRRSHEYGHLDARGLLRPTGLGIWQTAGPCMVPCIGASAQNEADDMRSGMPPQGAAPLTQLWQSGILLCAELRQAPGVL